MASLERRPEKRTGPAGFEADICLIAEGCYPYVSGGVSSWIDWLMRSQPHLTFSVLAILPSNPEGPSRYERPDNLVAIHHMLLDSPADRGGRWPSIQPEDLASLILRLLDTGDPADLRQLMGILQHHGSSPSLAALLNSPRAWQTICSAYTRSMPHAAFLAYFWAWRALIGGMFRTLTCPLPRARLYHTVSTGYAGLLAARATLETGRASILTEHGIYSNERRIEILMAEWIEDSLDQGLDITDDRRDVRDLWARAFESYARPCYGIASEIITLYSANQQFQLDLGADPNKMRVIANGIDADRFDLPRETQSDRPTIAFVGRVTPIKDVQAFIDVAERVSRQFPGLRALILGPMDEDPDYARDCVADVKKRGIEHIVSFIGPVNVREYLPKIDVLVLTSISEAQPLVILEAGAASVPCVTTDVGACREILEGSATEQPPIGRGGIVAPVGAADEVAKAVVELLSDQDFRIACGERLRRRVNALYRSDRIAMEYRDLYARNLDATVAGAA